MQTLLYFSSILLTCVLTGGLGFFAWRQSNVPGARAYSMMAFGECLLALADTLSMLSPGRAQALFWFNMRFIFTASIPVLWLVFAIQYNGRKEWLSNHLIAVAFIIPVVTQLIIWSNNLYGLWVQQEVGFYQSGPFWISETSARIPSLWFMVHSLYSLLLLLAGIVITMITTWSRPRMYRRQAILLTSGGLIALVAALIPVFNLIPQAKYNPFIPGIGASAVLYALAIFRFQFLKRAPAGETVSKINNLERQEKRSLALFILIFVLLMSGIVATGYLSYKNYEGQFRIQMESQLSAIAELKVSGLEAWRAERLADAEVIHENTDFAALVQTILKDPANAQAEEQLQTWLDSLRSAHGYERVFLLDTDGVEKIASPSKPEPVAEHLSQEVVPTLKSGKVVFVDFHRHIEGGSVHLAILAPIYANQDVGQPLGVVVLDIDPEWFLYPYISKWPALSSTAETLLVRRDGKDALYLNSLRFQSDAALNLRIPLVNTEVLAVKAVTGQTGIVEGIDYRGVTVIGDLRPVPGSPWFLVSRMDIAEVYAPLQERLWQTIAFFGALAIAALAGLGLVWRQQRVRYYRARYEAAEMLRASEEKFRKAFQISPDSIAFTRLTDGRFVSVNQGFTNILGYSEAEAVGKSSLMVWDDPEDRKKVVAELQANGVVENYEAAFRTKTGGLRRGLMSAALVELNGEPHILTTTRDITERKQAEEALRASEQKFRDTIVYLDEGYYSVSLEGVLLEHNQAFNRVLGFPASQNLRGSDISDFWQNPAERREYLNALAAAGSIINYQINAKTQTGKKITVLDSSHLVKDRDNRPLRIEGVFLDITGRMQQEAQILAAQAELQVMLAEAVQSRRALLSVVEDQKMAEEEIRRLNTDLEQRVTERTAQLEASNKELEAFAYSVSHDLRTPLRAIDGFSRLLMDDYADKLDDEGKRLFKVIRTNTAMMDQLITDLLALSRTTRTEMKCSRVDMAGLANSTYNEISPAEVREKFSFSVSDLPEALGDPTLLRQVWVNLLSNAIKYTLPKEERRIEVGWYREGEENVYFVKDSGVGFNPEYTHKLFGLFQRLHTSEEFEGTGVGLAIVQRIVQRHGGRVWAEGALNQGATFYFSLSANKRERT